MTSDVDDPAAQPESVRSHRPPSGARVLWVSTSLHTRGGVATSVRTLAASPLWSIWSVGHVTTHADGTQATKLMVYLRGLVAYLVRFAVQRPELVHIHTSCNASFIRKAVLACISRAWGVPVILHVHSGRFHVFFERAPRPAKWIIRVTLERAARVVSLDDVMSQRLRAISERATIVTVPNALAIHDAVAQPPDGVPVHVVYLGRIAAEKGVFDLLDAWDEILRHDGTSARLTIAGDGDVDAARRIVSTRGMVSTVVVRDWLAPDEVDALLREAQILALPSHSEGQPMAVLEGMARGLCVVASKVGGIPALVEDGVSGWLITPGDVSQLAVALQRAVADGAERAQLGKAARERVSRDFDIDVVWRRLDVLYRDVLNVSER